MLQPNEYASWSIAFKAMVKNYNEFADIIIGKKSNNDDLSLKEWSEITNNFFIKDDTLNDDLYNNQNDERFETLSDKFKSTFKIIDLGGGDQKELLSNKNPETIQKYKNVGVLTTGGADNDRIKNLINLNKLIHNENPSEGKINALKLNIETKLTGASFYDKAQQLLKQEHYNKVCLIPIGSTDLHVITYNNNESVEFDNLYSYTSNARDINLKDINDNTLIVFAGSSRFYLSDIYNQLNAGVNHTTEVNLTVNPKQVELDQFIRSVSELASNPKIANFDKSLKRINFNGYTGNVYIMAGKDETHVHDVTLDALKKFFSIEIDKNHTHDKNRITDHISSYTRVKIGRGGEKSRKSKSKKSKKFKKSKKSKKIKRSNKKRSYKQKKPYGTRKSK
tara:strand:+ start:198 stop:1376 length:1179 start_codon:yes stop_codon:yes gene_type:complete